MNAIVSSTEFIAAVFGSVVGGLIALFAQMLALGDARRTRAREAKERQQALGRALFYRLYQISSDLTRYHRHVQTTQQKAARTGVLVGSWQSLTGIVNGPTAVTFTSDEAMLLLLLKEDVAFNRVISMDRLHSTTVKAWDAYAVERVSVLLKIPADVNGSVATYTLTDEVRRALAPQISSAQTLADNLINTSKGFAEEAENALQITMAALNRRLDLGLSINAGPDAPIVPAT